MIVNTKAKNELEKVKQLFPFLNKISNILYFIGVVAFIVGLICVFVGNDYLDDFYGHQEKRMMAPTLISSGIASIISCFLLLLLGAIGKAVNDIRIHTVADFNLRHKDENASDEDEKKAFEDAMEDTTQSKLKGYLGTD